MEFIKTILNYIIVLFMVAVFVRAVLSFVVYFVKPPYPALLISVDRLANQITEPVMAPVRRMLPSFGGLDFSPMVVIIVLLLIQYLIARL